MFDDDDCESDDLLLTDDEECDEYLDEECDECAGEGWIVDDCFEDCCCCVNPEVEHGLIPCPTCNPKGDN